MNLNNHNGLACLCIFTHQEIGKIFQLSTLFWPRDLKQTLHFFLTTSANYTDYSEHPTKVIYG